MADETRDFATAMRQARDRLVLTQAQLAEKVGVTGPTISNWENGKSAPEGEQRARVEEALRLGEGAPFGKRLQDARVRAALTQRETREADRVRAADRLAVGDWMVAAECGRRREAGTGSRPTARPARRGGRRR